MDGPEREKDKKTRFAVRPTKYVFIFFLSPAPSRPLVVMNDLQCEGPSPGPSCKGAKGLGLTPLREGP